MPLIIFPFSLVTLFGRTSAKTMNGNGRMPIEAINMTNDKLQTGTQLKSCKSKLSESRNEYAPITAKPRLVAEADIVNKSFRPTLSTNIVDTYVPIH